VRSLLRSLGYDPPDADGARLLRAAARLPRIFQLPVPDAPGLVFFGAQADPGAAHPGLAGQPVGSVGGSGLTPRRAFEACVGEAVEYLSQFGLPDDPLQTGTATDRLPLGAAFVRDVLASAGIAPDRPIGWLEAKPIGGGAPAWFPADLCLRRSAGTRDFTPPLKLSTGCAAGRTPAEATRRGLLELIERDAAALWWRGGRRPRPVPPDSAIDALIATLRGGTDARRTWLLDITTDLEVPVIAAVSAGADGFGFAFGLAARLTRHEAAQAALFELCQVELAAHVVAAKRREAGEAALNENDRAHVRRAATIDTRGNPLLHPVGAPRDADPGLPADPDAALAALTDRLAACGITAYAQDLTRAAFGIPVVRVLAFGLQPDPCAIATPRLLRAERETGGAAAFTFGMTLL
jgi:ribosomal protein S12 methylthiotransferase accessory factor